MEEVSPGKLSDKPEFQESGLVYLNSESEQSMGFSVQTEGSVPLSSEDIARACLSQEATKTHVIDLNGNEDMMRIDANSEFSIMRIHFNVKQSSKVCVEVVSTSGSSLITGKINSNCHFDFGYSEKLS